MGANAIFNILEQDDVVMVAEGLDVFRTPVPHQLAGLSLRMARVRDRTGCSIVAIEHNGTTIVNPDPDSSLPAVGEAELIVIGSTEAEHRFLETFLERDGRKRVRRI